MLRIKNKIQFSDFSILFPVLKKAFEAFDSQKSGSIPCDMVGDILRLMGQPYDKKILQELIDEVDADSKPNTVINNLCFYK